jgi:cytochrome c oxidase subunit 2
VTVATTILVFAFLVHLLIKYRRQAGRKGVYIHGNHQLEVAWTLTPALLLVIMGILSLRVWADVTLNPPNASRDEVTDVEVLAQQFQWNIRYPGQDGEYGTKDDIGSFDPDPDKAGQWITGEITVPVDKPVRVHLMSKDVIHSFFLAHMRMKRDAVPGLRGEVYFTPTRTGRFELTCSQLCGPQHYSMSGFLVVKNQEEYDRWLAERQAEVDERLAEEGGEEPADQAREPAPSQPAATQPAAAELWATQPAGS